VEIKEAGIIDQSKENMEDLGKKRMPNCLDALKKYYKGTIISNDGYTPESGAQKIAKDLCQMISFAKLGINNPDLPERIKHNLPLNEAYDMSTW